MSDGTSRGADAASIFGMPPSRPPVPKSGGRSRGAGAGGGSGNRPNASGKIGGAQANAVRRLAGIIAQ
jgi:hypothetical protein